MNWWHNWYIITKRRFAKKTRKDWEYHREIAKRNPPITRKDIIGSEVYIKSRDGEKIYLDKYKQGK